MLIPSILAKVTYAANNANDVNAAEAIAKPFPVAAVVFPTASKISARSLTIDSPPFQQFHLYYQQLGQRRQLLTALQ